MTKAPSNDQALGSLRKMVDGLKSASPTRTTDVHEKLDELIGMMPKFPGHFIYIYNYSEGKVVYAHGFDQVLGYRDTEVDLELLYRTWHPEDAPIVAKVSQAAITAMTAVRHPSNVFGLTLTVDYRIRKANGQYMKVLRQTAVFEVDERSGKVISTLSLCKDISTIKSSNVVGWQLHGAEDQKLVLDDLHGSLTMMHYRPSPREMDVVRKLAEGKSSKVIADELNISLHTVNAHRRNLLERSGLKNTTELIRRVVELGWM